MTPVRPEFLPDPELSREEMETLQYDVADAARWTDDFDFDPRDVSLESAASLTGDRPLVAGVDQAFLDDRAVSVVVLMRGGDVVERAHAVTDLSIPYVPGLLSFREGGPIVAAFEELSADPDLVVFDGSGRIHYRQAGLATHLGVVFDVPSVGVAKNLLCGRPREDAEGRPEGWRTDILADDTVENAESGDRIGHAYQSRQYDSSPIINPLYVSPGHRVSVPTATDLVSRLCGGYKLPEPTRRADAYADETKAEYA
ncbi:endonuclease V [Halogeometricum limi]|uniref:Endonuclease V n=1 Tax=Halogeometricum limi TaxID=555875 RepID=A0A1I6G5P7_9EURY|nr:endonuclease V [Halogeometricum limi]SFR37516.1 Endonuclease V [Halogeometricum limi]